MDGVKIGDDCESRLPGGAHCWSAIPIQPCQSFFPLFHPNFQTRCRKRKGLNQYTDYSPRTDYVLVDHHASSVGPWYSPVGQISCPADTNSHISSCNQQIGNLKQDADTCKNTLWNAGGKVGANIKTEINKIIGISFSAEASGSLGGSAVAYSTNTTIDACQWSGGSGCHQSWASQVIVSIRGFKCRTCATPSSDPNVNMPNMPVRASDNLYTCDMQDFQIDLASATTVDYDGGCIYQNTNPLPNIDPNPTPWPVSVA